MFTQVAAGCQPAATWVNTTRYCKYSQVLLAMGKNIAPKHVEPTWNNKLIYLMHLVGYFHSCYLFLLFASEFSVIELPTGSYTVLDCFLVLSVSHFVVAIPFACTRSSERMTDSVINPLAYTDFSETAGLASSINTQPAVRRNSETNPTSQHNRGMY